MLLASSSPYPSSVGCAIRTSALSCTVETSINGDSGDDGGVEICAYRIGECDGCRCEYRCGCDGGGGGNDGGIEDATVGSKSDIAGEDTRSINILAVNCLQHNVQYKLIRVSASDADITNVDMNTTTQQHNNTTDTTTQQRDNTTQQRDDNTTR